MTDDKSEGNVKTIKDFKPQQKTEQKSSNRSTILLSIGVICALILAGIPYMDDQITNGKDGLDGNKGDSSLITATPLVNSDDCATGGYQIKIGLDDDGDNYDDGSQYDDVNDDDYEYDDNECDDDNGSQFFPTEGCRISLSCPHFSIASTAPSVCQGDYVGGGGFFFRQFL